MYKVIGLAVALVLSLTVFFMVKDRLAPQPGILVRSEVEIKPEQTRPCPFPRIARRLRNQEPVNVVAIGSSSTEGAGATAPAKTYPARLKSYLQADFPGGAIEVHNRGISGDVAAQNLARFQKDVYGLGADLVIWQVGTNDALRNLPFDEFSHVIESGVSELRQREIDVALLDLQYLGSGNEKLIRYQAGIERMAERLGIERIPRWSLMKGLIESGEFTLADLVSADGLHTTDTTYDRTASYSADLIAKRCGK